MDRWGLGRLLGFFFSLGGGGLISEMQVQSHAAAKLSRAKGRLSYHATNFIINSSRTEEEKKKEEEEEDERSCGPLN
jgi:hypothetical protein